MNLVGRARDLRHPLAGRSALENIRRRTPHIVMCKHSSTWETLALNLYLPAARVRREEGAAVDPVLRLGLRARLADHDRPQGRHRRDGADRRSRAASASRRASGSSIYPEGTRIRAGTRAQVQDRRRAARDRAGRADPAGRAQRRLAVAEGHCSASGPGTITMSIGAPIATARQGRGGAHAGGRAWIEDEVARLGVPRVTRRDGRAAPRRDAARRRRARRRDGRSAGSRSPARRSTTG